MSLSDESIITDEALDQKLGDFHGVKRSGPVTSVIGPVIRAAVPDVKMAEICRIRRSGAEDLLAEVIGFDRQDALLMPLGDLSEIAAHALVEPIDSGAMVAAGAAVKGRVLDAMGRPMDDRGPIVGSEQVPQHSAPPQPLQRLPIDEPLCTGVRAIDGLLTVGRGQRVGIFAAAGVGKSTLLSMIARNVEADTVVVAMIGERGREVRPFLEDGLGKKGAEKSTVVVSTSDQPALLRLKAAYTATAIAEAARNRGEHVVLMMDSVTRFARALRDVGLAAGEPPGRQGYPASVFATLPLLFERAGNDRVGSITAFYTVLVTGDDIEEPVSDEAMSLLDGHIILSRRVANSGRYPAVDVPRSRSRLMDKIVHKGHLNAAAKAYSVIDTYERNFEKITIPGLYEPGSDQQLDFAVEHYDSIVKFLRQDLANGQQFEQTLEQLLAVFPSAESGNPSSGS